MFSGSLQTYCGAVLDDSEINVAVYSIDSGDVMAVTYDVTVDINEYGELTLIIVI